MNISENILREITDVTKRILIGDYRYTDLKVLYMNIRELSISGSVTREIGDFIAHSERNKGVVFERVRKYYQQLSQVSSGGAATLEVVAPYSETEVVEDLVNVLMSIMPAHKVYLDRISEHKQGIFMCVLCILQGAIFTVSGDKVTFSWGVGENDNWMLMADVVVNHNGISTIVSIVTFESTLKLTEINKMQAPPFDCYERNGIVDVHMMW